MDLAQQGMGMLLSGACMCAAASAGWLPGAARESRCSGVQLPGKARAAACKVASGIYVQELRAVYVCCPVLRRTS